MTSDGENDFVLVCKERGQIEKNWCADFGCGTVGQACLVHHSLDSATVVTTPIAQLVTPASSMAP